MKDLSKIIREFENLPYNSYERRRTNHEPTDSYFYLSRHLVKCIIRAYSLDLHVYTVSPCTYMRIHSYLRQCPSGIHHEDVGSNYTFEAAVPHVRTLHSEHIHAYMHTCIIRNQNSFNIWLCMYQGKQIM